MNLLQLEGDEKVSAVFPISEFEEEANLLMVTRQGVVKKSSLSLFTNIRQNGLIAIAIREGDELISVIRTHGDDSIIIGTRDGMAHQLP